MPYFAFSSAGGAVGVETPPGTPTGLTAVKNSATPQTAIDLAWTLATSRPRERGVRVLRSTDGGTTYAPQIDLPAGSTAYTDPNLAPGFTYYYEVAGIGKNDILSAPSSPASATTDTYTAPVADFTGTPLSAQTGSAIQFTNASTNYATSSWDFGDTGISTADSPSHTYSTAGIYTVALTVTGPGGSDTKTRTGYITITDPPANPNFVSATIDVDGASWAVLFDATVTGHTGLTATDGAGHSVALTYVSGEGATTLNYTGSPVVYQGSAPKISYPSGDIVHGASPLAAFSNLSVTNNSTQQPSTPSAPTFTSATVAADGLTWTLVLSEAVTGHSGFSPSLSGGPITLTYVSGESSTALTFSGSRTVLQGETGQMDYTAGDVVNASSVHLATFTGGTLTNNSTQTAAAPTAPTNFAATTGDDSQIVLTWKLADATDSSITLERSPSGAGTYSTIATRASGTQAHTDTGPLADTTTYDYRIRASNASGDSAWVTASGTTSAPGYRTDCALQSFSASTQSAFRNRLSWTTPANPLFDNGLSASSLCAVIYRSADGGVTFTKVNAQSVGKNITYTWDDYPLTPGTVYQYQARIITPGSRGAFSSTSATTSAQGALPNVPTGLAKSEQNTTQAIITWTDTNSGTASYLIETAPIPGAGVPDGATWTPIAETAVGATSYTLTTVARRSVYWRLRAKNGSGNSEYTLPNPDLTIRPPSGDVATNIHIGAGQAYTSIAAAQSAIHTLGKGSNVYLHSGTYAEHMLVACRGTAAEPISFIGVDDGSGYPVLDGYLAVESAAFTPGNSTTFYGFANILIHRLASAFDTAGYQPGHLVFQNIITKRCSFDNSPNTYTDPTGATQTYLGSAAGCYIASGDNILFDNCEFRDNGNGLFGAADGTDIRYLSDLTVRSCYFEGNGQANSATRHQSYIEAVRTTYEYCWYGPTRTLPSPTQGAQLKDRGPSTVVRYCRIDELSLRILDIVEAQNNFNRTYLDPNYHITHVYGCLLANNTSLAHHYGGDSAMESYYRNGQLRFYHNTVIVDTAAIPTYRSSLFYANGALDTVDVRNCVWFIESGVSEANLFTDNTGTTDTCVGVFVSDFVRSNWQYVRSGDTFDGMASGTDTFLTNATNEPAFVGVGDYRVLAGTDSSGAGGRIPSDWPVVDREYVHPRSSQARAKFGVGSDLGYTTAVPDTTPPSATSITIDQFGGTLAITFTKKVVSTGTGYSLSLSGGAVTLTYQGGSGTNQLSWTLSRIIINTETGTAGYSSSTGDTTDTVTPPNVLASFSGAAVTNNSQETSSTGDGVRSVSTSAPSTLLATISLTRPTGLTDGESLRAAVYVSGPASATVTPPSNTQAWVEVGTPQYDGYSGGRLWLFRKDSVTVANEPATYDFGISPDAYAGAACTRIKGFSGGTNGTPAQGAGANSTTQTSPSVTTTVDGCFIMRWLAIDRSYTVTRPAGEVLKVDMDAPLQYGGHIALAVVTQTTAGATGTADFTLSTARPGALFTEALAPG